MIVEERIYRIRPGQMQSYLHLVSSEGSAIQRPILGDLSGYFTTEIASINQVIHLWCFADLNDRAARQRTLATNPHWQEFTRKPSATIEVIGTGSCCRRSSCPCNEGAPSPWHRPEQPARAERR